MRGHRGEIDLGQLRELPHLKRMVLTAGNYVNVADGVSITLHRLVETLHHCDVDVAVIAPDGEHPELTPPRTKISVPSLGLPIQKGYRLSLGLQRRTIARIEAFQPQLLHVATPDLAGVMAARYARRRGLPLVSTFHTNFAAYLRYWGWLPSALTPLAWNLTRRFYSQFDEVYVPTNSMGDELVGQGVLSKYAVLPRGVDHHRFNPDARSMPWRQQHGIKPDDVVIHFCARIVWEKGLRTLVDTLRLLDKRGSEYRCVVVGDGAQKPWLEKNLPEAIFPGFLTGPDLATAYASGDIFLYPSTTDTFGNVTLEAMASGLPVVGACAPGTRCIVEDGASGILVEPDDPQAFADATAYLLENEMARRRLAEGAVRRAGHFRWPEIINRFAADLDRLVA